MPATRPTLIVTLVFVASLGHGGWLFGQDDWNQNEFPARPAPGWVRMIDQGERDPALKGILTPAGVRVEIVARQPTVIDPVGMTFSADGTPHVLEWRVAAGAKHATYEVTFKDGSKGVVNRMVKDGKDELKTLHDDDGDGVYETARVVMNDLEIPSSLLLHEDWAYLPSIGRVIRRKRSRAGGPYDVTEEIVRGLCGFHHHQASGVTLSHDGWLYITSGDDDNRAEGSDGSRATVLRTGAIFRCRPDGSQVGEFARGFRNPYRDVAQDHFFNVFHVDNDQEDGSKFQGARLMHVQEGADYGWRLIAGAVCCRTDFARGAVFGEAPGKMPSLLKTGRGSPAGLLIYQGTAFPEFFRGLLVYADVYRKLVRAYKVERAGGTFRVVEQFTLMSSEDGLFRPCQALQGPDGAIYIVDWRTDSGGAGRLWGDGVHGRIYRLSWSGLEGHPAIAPAPRDSWAKLLREDDADLWRRLESPDFELRFRALNELSRRGAGSEGATREKFVALARDARRPAFARAAALGGACRFYDAAAQNLLRDLLADEHFELRRLAADGLSRHAAADLAPVLAALTKALDDEHPAPRRAAALALGRVASRLPNNDPGRQAAALALLAALRKQDRGDPYTFDGVLRGLERLGETGLGALAGLVRAADPAEVELGVSAFEATRVREAADALDRLLREDAIDNLKPEQQVRLIATYRHILVEPAIRAAEVGAWLERHPDAPVETRITGLETIGLVGGAANEAAVSLAIRLLAHEDAGARARVARAIGDAGIKAAAAPLAAALADPRRGLEERREALQALSRLRSTRLPFLAEPTPPGVELVLDKLQAVARDPEAGELRGETLAVIAQVNHEAAAPLAKEILAGSADKLDARLAAAAINVLGARAEDAKHVGREFAAGKLPRELLPQVAEALRRHQEKDASGEINELLTRAFQGGLLVSLAPAEVARIEKLVRVTGDARRGKEVFLGKKTQCAVCHQLEGVGGQVGPNLTKVHETHTVSKLVESLIDPSKEIKEGFGAWTALTTGGQVYTGLKISQTPKELVLRDASGKDVRLAAADVEELTAAKKSLMPDGVAAQLSYQEFIDLLAFLKDAAAQQSLRAP